VSACVKELNLISRGFSTMQITRYHRTVVANIRLFKLNSPKNNVFS